MHYTQMPFERKLKGHFSFYLSPIKNLKMKNIINVIRAILRIIIDLFRRNKQQENEQAYDYENLFI